MYISEAEELGSEPRIVARRGSLCLLWKPPGRDHVCSPCGDLFVKNMFEQVLQRLSLLRHHGISMMAHLQTA